MAIMMENMVLGLLWQNSGNVDFGDNEFTGTISDFDGTSLDDITKNGKP